MANGYNELPVTSVHGIVAGELPFAHKDPFDRLLVAQAREERLALLTSDAKLIDFGAPVLAI